MDEEDYFDTVYQTKDIIRITLLAAYSDGSMHSQEYEKAIEVFTEISDEFLGEHDSSVLSGQVERIASGIREEVYGLDPKEIRMLALETAALIEDRSSQELALKSALRVAYGDYEIDKLESDCITEIAQFWGITLRSLI
jgi:tellurite resistance protein